MKLTNTKLFALSCIVVIFILGYSQDYLYGYYNSISAKVSQLKSGNPSTTPTDTKTVGDSSNHKDAIVPPPQTPGESPNQPPPHPFVNPPKTNDIGAALEGIGPGGVDKNMINQRQEYLKNLNAQLREQHGGVLPTTTTTLPSAVPPQLPGGGTPPPSPDLLPQNPPPSAVPGANPQGWVAPPPLIQQGNTPLIDQEEDEPTEVGEDEDLETDEGDEDDTADDTDTDDDTSDDAVE